MEGNFTGVLDYNERFGNSVVSPGDPDGDGIVDVAFGARLDDDGGFNRGAEWVLFLDGDGTVKDHCKISDTGGNSPPISITRTNSVTVSRR